MRKIRIVSIILIALFGLTLPTFAAEGRLLRFADIHDEQVAFVFAGDLWSVSASGGQARRLTSHAGMELFPKFSPDGHWIAFSAEYSGSRQVFVIPAEGGSPRQLTFYNDVGQMPPRGGFDNQILGWTPDGKQILFRANRTPWGVRMGRPYLVPFDGGNEQATAIPEGGGGELNTDGHTMVYTPIAREFRTWKRYRGGRAQDIWTYDLKHNVSHRLTDDPATDNQPTWVGDTIYFTSDRDGMLNLHSLDPNSKSVTQATHHKDYDVLWPSSDGKRVVYEAGGYLYIFDPVVGGSTKIDVELNGDFPVMLPRWIDVSENIDSAEPGPGGNRVLFEARGDLFSVPAENGETRNLTQTPGVRERNPTWSPDGSRIAYWSDADGEYELYTRDATENPNGGTATKQLTHNTPIWKFAIEWSPDGSSIAYADKNQQLWIVDADSGKSVEVDHSTGNDIQHYRWSPDSKWLAYTILSAEGMQQIRLWSADLDQPATISNGFTNDYEPVFDPKGRYLYFLSDRDFNLEFSGYEFNYLYVNPTRVYAALLTDITPALMQPKSDEETVVKKEDGDENAEGEKEEKKDSDKDDVFTIELDGLLQRIVALPSPAANFGNLQATEKGLFFARFGDEGPKVQFFSIDSGKVEDVLPGVGNFDLSGDGKKLLYAQRGNFGIVPAQPGQKADDGKLNLGGLRVRVEAAAEWEQIFLDGWRLIRDWFYDPNLHGLDWNEMWDLYSPLVKHVRHRGDLDYIFGELGGELNSGHFYVNWGDMPQVERVQTGLLGAEILAHKSGYYRVEKILPGENWHPQFRSPLTQPGVDVSVGDFILAVNGRSVKEVANFYELLQNTVGHDVVLHINSSPKPEGARDVTIRPTAAEGPLRYLDWLESRRRMVDEISNGRIGYIHLPNTAGDGNRELHKNFYPLAQKDALIFDARYNGGGFIPDRMMELISRNTLSYWTQRGIRPFTTPGFAHNGPKACLINGYSSSGGDAFPHYFRELGLGPIVGTRTWGGLIGLQGNPQFMDGGALAIPRFRFAHPDGYFAVENEGVAPDFEVIDRPEEVVAGKDPSLETAIKLLLETLKNNPPQPFVEPTPPSNGRRLPAN